MDDILERLAQAQELLEQSPEQGNEVIEDIYNDINSPTENFEQIPFENSSLENQNSSIPNPTENPEDILPTTNTMSANQIAQGISQDIIQKFESLGIGKLLPILGDTFVDNLLDQVSANVLSRLQSVEVSDEL